MDKRKILARIKELYEKENVNIIEYLKKLDMSKENTLEDIMISYDFQAGSYTELYHTDETERNTRGEMAEKIAEIIDSLDCDRKSIFEAGIGEATCFSTVRQQIKRPFVFSGGGQMSLGHG